MSITAYNVVRLPPFGAAAAPDTTLFGRDYPSEPLSSTAGVRTPTKKDPKSA